MPNKNKRIDREGQGAAKIFDDRSLKTDYRTLFPLLKAGMDVLDIGCGTGAISKDMANLVGPLGRVTGIDNTERFIASGRQSYDSVANLNLICADLFEYDPEEKYDLIVAARVLQWLSNPEEALLKMKSLLKPNGIISILDYNHIELEWDPEPPESMIRFYKTFLRWRADAGMNNTIADDLPEMFERTGLVQVQKINSDECYTRSAPDFRSKVGIWSKVAGSTQMVKEGYLEDEIRLRAISEYNEWVEDKAVSMTMKLNEVRGRVPE